MKSDSPTTMPSDAVRAEAAAWVARLHSCGRTRELEAGLRKWLKADEAHARAFEIATEAWEIGGSLRSRSVSRIADPFAEAPQGPARSKQQLAMVAVLLMAVAAGGFFWAKRHPAIVTAVGEQRILTLTDGSRIFLNTDTRLFVRETAQQRRVQLESGEALFDVAQDPHRPFIVAAGNKEVVALGTSFVVRRETGELVVTLMEGRVSVNSAASETMLTPGQRVVFADDTAPTLDKPPLESVTAWRRGEVVLDKTRLRDAADEMNRYSAVKLQIADDRVADIPVSGIFRAGDSARFARAVAATYHLGIEHERQRIVISGARP